MVLIKQFNNLLISMRNIDDYFQEVAYSMGFKPEDLLPIDRQVLELQSAQITKGMAQKQKQFYMNKKMTTLLQRQNHIFKSIQQQIKHRQFSYKLSSDNRSKFHNPAVMKLLEDHDKMINKNKRYIDTIFKKKWIDQDIEERRRTISNQKQRMTGQSFRSNASSVSSASNRSKLSGRSNLSAVSNRSTASNKERLNLIRQKKREEEQLKKKAYQQKQQQDSKKSLRAIQNLSRKSQRVKTKTAVSKQIVEDNKKELDFIKSAEIKDHLQRLKFKIQRTQMIRAKHYERKESRERSTQGRGLKQLLQDEKKQIMRSKIDEKNRTTSLRFQHQELVKRQAHTFNKIMHDLKFDNVKKNRDLKNKEQQSFLNSVKMYQQHRLRTAEVNRNAIKDSSLNERYLTREIRHDIAHKNVQSVNHRRLREAQQLRKKIDNRFSQIKQIDEIKQKLTRQRQKLKKDLTFQRKSLEVNNYRPKFNSFFDI